MIIKAVTRNGDAIPQSAEEALNSAIVAALKTKNTPEVVYWADPKSTDVASFRTTNTAENGAWEAWVSGKVKVGKTITINSRFYSPKSHTFDVHYKLGKNELGMPDVKIVSFEMKPIDTNPISSIGSFEQDSREPVLGEIQPQQKSVQQQKQVRK